MSRSHKHKHISQRVKDAIDQGYIIHDHRARVDKTGWDYDREHSTLFPKANSKEIHAYREFLGSLGDEYRWTEVESHTLEYARDKGNYIYAQWKFIFARQWSVWHEMESDEHYKTIEFRVERWVEKDTPLNGECDLAFYDWTTGKNKETGEWSRCRPDFWKLDNGTLDSKPYWTRYQEEFEDRSKRRAVKAEMHDLTRQGTDLLGESEQNSAEPFIYERVEVDE